MEGKEEKSIKKHQKTLQNEEKNAKNEEKGAKTDEKGARADPKGAKTDGKSALPNLKCAISDQQGAKTDEKGARADQQGALHDPKGAETDGKSAHLDLKCAIADPSGAKNDEKGAETDEKGARTDPQCEISDQQGAKTDGKSAPPDPNGAKTDGKSAHPAPKGAETDGKGALPNPNGAIADPNGAKTDGKSARAESNGVKNEAFFIVPSRVFDMSLSPYEFSVLCYLIMRSDNKNHTCFPSVKRMASACKISERKVRDVIHSLQEKKFIKIEAKFVSTHNDFNRQTSNHYSIDLVCIPPAQNASPTCTVNIPPAQNASPACTVNIPPAQNASPTCTVYSPPMQDMHPPPARPAGEINKTIPNRTKSNITISTELSMSEAQGAQEAVEEEKERFSFVELKRECFEILKNERGIDEELIALLDRSLEHLWFKNEAEYEGRKYSQNELRAMLCTKVTPDTLAYSVEFLSHSKEPIRSPVPYLAKCLLGAIVKGALHLKWSKNDEGDPFANAIRPPENFNPSASSFDLDDFFSAALNDTYGFQS